MLFLSRETHKNFLAKLLNMKCDKFLTYLAVSETRDVHSHSQTFLSAMTDRLVSRELQPLKSDSDIPDESFEPVHKNGLNDSFKNRTELVRADLE